MKKNIILHFSFLLVLSIYCLQSLAVVYTPFPTYNQLFSLNVHDSYKPLFLDAQSDPNRKYISIHALSSSQNLMAIEIPEQKNISGQLDSPRPSHFIDNVPLKQTLALFKEIKKQVKLQNLRPGCGELSMGHLAASGNYRSYADKTATFNMVNQTLQERSFNSGPWTQLEQCIQEWKNDNPSLNMVVLTGVIYPQTQNLINNKVPSFYYKTVFIHNPDLPDNVQLISFVMENRHYDSQSMKNYSMRNNIVPTSSITEKTQIQIVPQNGAKKMVEFSPNELQQWIVPIPPCLEN